MSELKELDLVKDRLGNVYVVIGLTSTRKVTLTNIVNHMASRYILTGDYTAETLKKYDKPVTVATALVDQAKTYFDLAANEESKINIFLLESLKDYDIVVEPFFDREIVVK